MLHRLRAPGTWKIPLSRGKGQSEDHLTGERSYPVELGFTPGLLQVSFNS